MPQHRQPHTRPVSIPDVVYVRLNKLPAEMEKLRRNHDRGGDEHLLQPLARFGQQSVGDGSRANVATGIAVVHA